jgi:MoaA/NifB/PqqE/SkfB family radical SAM enzyme
MNELDTFTLFLTWKCNFSCSHCGFSCGPERNEKIDLKIAKKYIEEASLNKNLKMVAYSGGEPFLYIEELKELMAFSNNKGLRAGVVTNCFWADSEKIAFELLSELKGLGLDEIITSLDDYHLKHVDIGNINNVVNAAVSLGIMVGINILMTTESRVRKETLNELLDITGKLN